MARKCKVCGKFPAWRDGMCRGCYEDAHSGAERDDEDENGRGS